MCANKCDTIPILCELLLVPYLVSISVFVPLLWVFVVSNNVYHTLFKWNDLYRWDGLLHYFKSASMVSSIHPWAIEKKKNEMKWIDASTVNHNLYFLLSFFYLFIKLSQKFFSSSNRIMDLMILYKKNFL